MSNFGTNQNIWNIRVYFENGYQIQKLLLKFYVFIISIIVRIYTRLKLTKNNIKVKVFRIGETSKEENLTISQIHLLLRN